MRTKLLFAFLFPLLGSAVASAAGIETKSDIAYRSDKDADSTRHKLDVYYPKEAKNAPVLFFVHGGAWVIGSKETFVLNGKGFAEAGYVVVSTNYRLTPKVKHPGHIEDVAKAFAWTVDNIAKYGGDPKKIVVSGHSAGGHLVSLLATNETYLKAEKKSFEDIRGVIGVSGVYNIDHRVKIFHTAFGDSEEACKSGSPMENVGTKHPPMMLIYGDKDLPSLGAQAKAFNDKLTKAKCESTQQEFKEKDHMTIMFKATSKDDPVFAAMTKFIDEKTKAKEKEKQ